MTQSPPKGLLGMVAVETGFDQIISNWCDSGLFRAPGTVTSVVLYFS